MPTLLDELEAQVLGLAPQDRAHLLERLIYSFEPDTELERTWVSEALRREADVHSGRSRMVAGPEALERARARIA